MDGLFNGLQLVFDFPSSASYKVKKTQHDKIVTNGGVVSYIVTRKSNFLVVDEKTCKLDGSYKVKQARKYGIHIMSTVFIDECIEHGALLPYEKFELCKEHITVDTKSQNAATRPNKVVSFATDSVRSSKARSKKTIDPGRIKVHNTISSLWETCIILKCTIFQHDKNLEDFATIELQKKEAEASDKGKAVQFCLSCQYRELNKKGLCTEYRFVETINEALAVYQYVWDLICSKGYIHQNMFNTTPVEGYGSKQLYKKWQTDYISNNLSLSRETKELVESVWIECLGEIKQSIAVPVNAISSEQVLKCESLLYEMKACVKKGCHEKLSDLTDQFYASLPHKDIQKITDLKTIVKKENLCQLLKDVVAVMESTHWRDEISVNSKYKALRCCIDCLDKDSPQYKYVHNLVISSHTGTEDVQIHNIFSIGRDIEETNFKSDIGNTKLLFHASGYYNYMPILSRGLLLPQTVVADYGGKRTDPGLLGCGIYFADSVNTSMKYSTIGNQTGTRLLLVSEVALGEIYNTTQVDTNLTSPPTGYNSVLGKKDSKSGETTSQFKDNEYAVYNTNQQKMKYLVEFTLNGEIKKEVTLCENESDSKVEEVAYEKESLTMEDGKKAMPAKVKAGLQTNDDKPVPLKNVHVRAKLLDLATQVVVLQEYHNNNNSLIEAKYVFPLDDNAVVCGFEAFINGKHVVGKVKEKEKARKEYRQAIQQGHGAYLMEEEKKEVFSVSVGNLPPHAAVLIKITYVAELTFDDDIILFTLPATVAPWDKDAALSTSAQHQLDSVKVKKVDKDNFSLQVSVDMPFDIKTITSPTHAVKMKKTATKGFIEFPKNSSLEKDFVLKIGLNQVHVPRMWVEKHPDKQSQACMLTFYPEFDLTTQSDPEVILMVDCSNSMKQEALRNAKRILGMCMLALPDNAKFNVVTFHTQYEEVFAVPLKKSEETLIKARSFQSKGISQTRGNTDLWQPLKDMFTLTPSDTTRNIFIISDGHISNADVTLELVKKHSLQNRIFTFGVGSSMNHHFLKRLANVGHGHFEQFDNSRRSSWYNNVKSQIEKCCQPSVSDVIISWQNFNRESDSQAPHTISSVFNGSRLVVYGFVENSTQATLHAVKDGREFSMVISTHELNITTGKILHTLTARALIQDWENGLLDSNLVKQEVHKKNTKQKIIDLSSEYSVVTQFTSFVAIEERTKEEQKQILKTKGPAIEELVQKETVDALPYINWEVDIPDEKKAHEKAEDELNRLQMALSYSVMESEQHASTLIDLEEDLDKEEFSLLRKKISEELYDFYTNVQKDSNKAAAVRKQFVPQDDKLNINIKTLTGRTISFDALDKDQTILVIKKLIYDREGVSPDSQRLMYNGKQLEDSKSLKDYNIEDSSQLYLVLRLRGGPDVSPALTDLDAETSKQVDIMQLKRRTKLIDNRQDEWKAKADVSSPKFTESVKTRSVKIMAKAKSIDEKEAKTKMSSLIQDAKRNTASIIQEDKVDKLKTKFAVGWDESTKDIKRIEKERADEAQFMADLAAVNDMFKDLSKEVHEQGDIIDTSHRQLARARTYERAERNKIRDIKDEIPSELRSKRATRVTIPELRRVPVDLLSDTIESNIESCKSNVEQGQQQLAHAKTYRGGGKIAFIGQFEQKRKRLSELRAEKSAPRRALLSDSRISSEKKEKEKSPGGFKAVVKSKEPAPVQIKADVLLRECSFTSTDSEEVTMPLFLKQPLGSGISPVFQTEGSAAPTDVTPPPPPAPMAPPPPPAPMAPPPMARHNVARGRGSSVPYMGGMASSGHPAPASYSPPGMARHPPLAGRSFLCMGRFPPPSAGGPLCMGPPPPPVIGSTRFMPPPPPPATSFPQGMARLSSKTQTFSPESCTADLRIKTAAELQTEMSQSMAHRFAREVSIETSESEDDWSSDSADEDKPTCKRIVSPVLLRKCSLSKSTLLPGASLLKEDVISLEEKKGSIQLSSCLSPARPDSFSPPPEVFEMMFNEMIPANKLTTEEKLPKPLPRKAKIIPFLEKDVARGIEMDLPRFSRLKDLSLKKKVSGKEKVVLAGDIVSTDNPWTELVKVHISTITNEQMQQIFNWQNESGYWQCHEDIFKVLQINKTDLVSRFKQFGLYSLGDNVTKDTENMLITLVVLLICFKKNFTGVNSLRNIVILGTSHIELKTTTTSAGLLLRWKPSDRIEEHEKESSCELDKTRILQLSNCVRWLLEKDAENPLLYSTLQLAKSKDEMIADIYDSIKY